MSEYMVTVQTDTSKELLSVGPFYLEQRADKAAREQSRMFTSPGVIAVVTCSDDRRGYPRAYRMGRLYKL